MTEVLANLQRLGLTLPPAAKPIAAYVPVVYLPQVRLAYVSGQVPLRNGSLVAEGSVPDRVSIESAKECARQCVLNGLAALQAEIGDLRRVCRVVRVGVFVACQDGFADHPKVANGASDLLIELFGELGKHVRAAVGAPSLPLNAPVEVEFLFEVE
jgi:enamine deaminase RidA (YjgF/YER057c/UK114 family)